MAFAQGFKYDIFISYSHDDNYHGGDKPGWVDEFHEELDSKLVNLFGFETVKIWRDVKLDGNTIFDDRIEKVIKGSALFFALTSPNYFKSEYCRKELDCFISQAKASKYGLRVGLEDRRRLFNILLRNVGHMSWPEELSGTSGFPMHDEPYKSEKPGAPVHRSDERQFREKMDSIIKAIDATLNAFPRVSREDKTPDGEEEPFNIFIADVADTLQNTRKLLIKDLESKNILIHKSIPPPMENAAHETAVAEAINGADLAVHLLDGLPGRSIMGMESSSYPRRQVEIGLQSNTRQIIWVPNNLIYENIEEKDHAKFLKSLESGDREKKAYGFSRESKTYLTELVLEEMARIQRQREEVTDPASILLATHPKDELFAFKLAVYLKSNGFNIQFHQESRDHATSLRNFEASLKYAHNLIILFGQVASTWVLDLLKIMMKSITSQIDDMNKIALKNWWLYLLPSSKITGDIKNLQKYFKINYLHNSLSDSIDESAVKPLLDRKKDWGRA